MERDRIKEEDSPIFDFRIIEESWTDYELENEAKIRIKIVLNYLISHDGPDGLGMNVNTQIATWAPRGLRGKPSEPVSVDELENTVVTDNVMHRCIREGESRYSTPFGPVTLKTRAKGFKMTSHHDRNGMPVFIVNHETSVEGLPKEKDGNSAAPGQQEG